MSNPVVQIKKLSAAARTPKYMTLLAAGMDIVADLSAPVLLLPGERCLIPTGIAMAIPVGYEVQVRPRSGLAIKHGVTLVNSPGTIDADYRGEIKIVVINHGSETFQINAGDRIAQLIVAPVVQAALVEVTDLDQTDRGSGGFGHTDQLRDNQ